MKLQYKIWSNWTMTRTIEFDQAENRTIVGNDTYPSHHNNLYTLLYYLKQLSY